jgi:glycosyltransferase involved in cell wall biosynthesis
MEIVSLYTNFRNQGGAQNVVLQLSIHFNKEKPLILSETPSDQILPYYASLANFERFSFSNVRKHAAKKDVIFVSHHRKTTTKLMIYNCLLGNRLRVVHCAHSTFDNLRFLTWLPKHIIAVSNGVKENLISYFHVRSENITVIYNGIKDCVNKENKKREPNTIRILLAGRICAVKRQIELVHALKGKLASHIQIDFAGKGPDESLLLNAIGDSSQFSYIGYITMEEQLNQYDYVLLFSEKEGLGLSLIYALMFSKPLITNNIPAMLDVNKAGEVGVVFDTMEELLEGINQLPLPSSQEYIDMSIKARKRYEENFKEEIMFEKYSEYFSQLISKRDI